jgi:hypothetical protein
MRIWSEGSYNSSRHRRSNRHPADTSRSQLHEIIILRRVSRDHASVTIRQRADRGPAEHGHCSA